MSILTCETKGCTGVAKHEAKVQRLVNLAKGAPSENDKIVDSTRSLCDGCLEKVNKVFESRDGKGFIQELISSKPIA